MDTHSRSATILGMADGMTTGIGLVLGMVVTHQTHLAIWAAGLSGGLSAFPGMASGQYQSAPEEGKLAAFLCGLATLIGTTAVAIPYVITRGTPALITACAIAFVLCAVVALIREQKGWQAFALSYGITFIAALLTLAGGVVQSLVH